MNYTSNYKLNLPEGRDVADISKLNENFTKLDSTVKTMDNRVTSVDNRVTSVSSQLSSNNSSLQSSINSVDANRKPVVGTYSGNGESSRTIDLGFQPSLVIVICRNESFVNASSGMTIPGYICNSNNSSCLSIAPNGFNVFFTSLKVFTNSSGKNYTYAAWR